MKASRLILSCIAFTLIAALPAVAGPRTFVSGLGNDANPGTREQPKRTFASALAVTDAGGDIVTLDSAGYGSSTLMINKSISIIAPPGVYAAIRVTASHAISISGAADTVVTLRGLTLTGQGFSTGHGVLFTAGAALHIQNCTISNFFIRGIECQNIPGVAEVYITDTTVRNGRNNGAAFGAAEGAALKVTIRSSHFLDNHLDGMIVNARAVAVVSESQSNGNGSNGFEAAFGGTVTVTRSVASENRAAGFSSHSLGTMNIDHCTASQNEFDGLAELNGPGGLGIMRISNSIVTNNGRNGFNGAPESLGNNLVRGNAGGDGASTIVPGL